MAENMTEVPAAMTVTVADPADTGVSKTAGLLARMRPELLSTLASTTEGADDEASALKVSGRPSNRAVNIMLAGSSSLVHRPSPSLSAAFSAAVTALATSWALSA